MGLREREREKSFLILPPLFFSLSATFISHFPTPQPLPLPPDREKKSGGGGEGGSTMCKWRRRGWLGGWVHGSGRRRRRKHKNPFYFEIQPRKWRG